MSQEYQNLVQTLISSKLAASSSEAQRMAKEMLNISDKVLNDSKKEQHYMVSNFKPSEEPVSQASTQPDVDLTTGAPKSYSPDESSSRLEVSNLSSNSSNSSFALKSDVQQKPLEQATNASMPDSTVSSSSASLSSNSSDVLNENIENLRRKAINPEPVNVQVDFQTPDFDAKLNSQAQSSNNSGQPGQMTPEDYSAQKLAGSSLNELNNDFLSLKTPPQEQKTEELDSGWPTQQQEPNVTNNDYSQGNFREETTKNVDAIISNLSGTNNSVDSRVSNKSVSETASQSEPVSNENNDFIATYQDEASEETTREIKTERKQASWTPEEEKLREQVDLSRVFNFSNK